MLKKIMTTILFLSFCSTAYFTLDIISHVHYVPTGFYTSLGIFVLILFAIYSERTDENKIIKINYKDFTYNIKQLLESNTKEFNEYVTENNIVELEKLMLKVISYQRVINYLISSHTDQFSLHEQFHGATGEQAYVNKLLVQERDKFVKIEAEIFSYIHNAKEKQDV